MCYIIYLVFISCLTYVFTSMMCHVQVFVCELCGILSVLCAGFSVPSVKSLVCVMCGLDSVLCAVLRVCVMCNLQSRALRLRSEHASLRRVGKPETRTRPNPIISVTDVSWISCRSNHLTLNTRLYIYIYVHMNRKLLVCKQMKSGGHSSIGISLSSPCLAWWVS